MPAGENAPVGQRQCLGAREVAAFGDDIDEPGKGVIDQRLERGAHLADERIVDIGLSLERAGLHLVEIDADGVEELARVDMLCLDKTGTLTEGRMVLDTVEPLAGSTVTAAVEPLGTDSLSPAAHAALSWMGADRDANATARALAERFTTPPAEPSVRDIEFSSRRKWSAVSFADGPARGTWVMGAPDIVLADVPGSTDALARFAERATAGERTVVLARTEFVLDPPVETADGERAPEHELPTGLRAVALVSFREKVRDDAHETLSYFREHEVELCVISGDDQRTVAAVAREAGIHHDGPGFDARTLPTDDAELDAIMAEHRVFGRVTPEQKKAMVLSLQRLGHTVAMTGDGVNDALALKHADLGIAMGSGAAATRAVARLVLLDGQFSRLPRIVAEGRQVIANVERLATRAQLPADGARNDGGLPSPSPAVWSSSALHWRSRARRSQPQRPSRCKSRPAVSGHWYWACRWPRRRGRRCRSTLPLP